MEPSTIKGRTSLHLVVTLLAAGVLFSTVTPVAHAAFPGANGEIAFATTRNADTDVYVMSADGTNQVNLTAGTTSDSDPSWSPDGTKIAYTSYDGDQEISVMNADGTNQMQLTADPATDFWPTWSPDGSKIAFSSFRDGNYELYSMNADGTNQTNLTNSTLWEVEPSWSPDGTKIAFRSINNSNNSSDIYSMNADGTNPTNLSNNIGFDSDPDWSPDGAMIVFESERGAPDEIYTMNADGTDQTRITNNTRDDFAPAWSPDGTKIAFQRTLDGGPDDQEREIFVMNADGSGETRISNNLAQDLHPTWQPLQSLDAYPRPGGGTPVVTYLVPAYESCSSPNTNHIAPLAAGSCAPPVQSSDLLTTSKIGQGHGFVRFDTVVGDPLTAANEADIAIQSEISDVRDASDQSDYSGQVLLSIVLRITDRASGFGGVSGTVSDFRFDLPIDCTPTVAVPNGSDCELSTSADSMVPGMVPEGKRSIVSTQSLQVLDAGADAELSLVSCPPTCGTGDEERFLEQGVFTP